MWFRVLGICAGLLLSAGAAIAEDEAQSPYLTPEEHAELLEMLDESRDMFLGLITGLSEEQWNFQQNPDRWSTGQCAEHIVRSQRALLDFAKAALSGEPDPEWAERTKGKNKMIRAVMPNRQPMGRGGASAPIEIRPQENWDRAKAIKEFYTIQGECVAYVELLTAPAKEYTAEHPFPVFNWLSAYDWLVYIPLHTVRHSRQIIEVHEDPNFPKE